MSESEHVDKVVVIFLKHKPVAFSRLTHTLLSLVLTAGATGQGFVACLSTGGYGIRAASPFGIAQFQEFAQWCLSAGTRLHQARGAWARLARAAVAQPLAPVSFTV